MKANYTRSFSFILIAIAYLTAFGSGSGVLYALPEMHPLWKLFIADVTATFVIWLFSLGFKNSSFYDAYWSVAPMVFVFYFAQVALPEADSFRQVLLFIAVQVWGLRLTLNWARGWPGIRHEDWRYGMLKQGNKAKKLAIDWFGIHFFPTVQVFLGCLPMYPAMSLPGNEVNGYDIIAFAICLSGAMVSLISDEQLRLFRKRIKAPGEFMQGGLWKYSRHPNYLGELLFWLGVYAFGLSARWDYAWTGVGVLAMYAMFRLASIPIMEKHMLQKRPEYKNYQKKTPVFLPIFMKPGS